VQTVRDWFDVRLGTSALYRSVLDRDMPDRLTWWHTLGSATFTTFVVLVVTGIVMATYYSASPDHAYDSVWYLQNDVLGGALVRGMHHWAASVMVVLLVAHMIRVFTWGAYKYPREANWWVGVFLFIVVMGFSFTGYLLPWDQKAYWATQVGISMAGTTPVVGEVAATALRGGQELGAATLARFYAFHTLWLPGVFGILVLVHIALIVRHGIAPEARALEVGAPERTTDPEYPAYYDRAYAASKSGMKRFWPDIIAKDIVVSVLVVAVIITLALLSGAVLEPPADPSDSSYVPTPEWYFLPLYQLLTLVPGSLEALVAVGVPTAFILSLLVLPLLDRRSRRGIRGRPIAAAVLVSILAGSGYLIGAANRTRTFVAPEQVGRPIPAAARTGSALYRVNGCGDCHAVEGQGGDAGPDLSDIGMRRSVGWLHSFIEDPSRFHEDSRMPAFGVPQLSHQDVEEIASYLATLRGDALPSAVPEFADTFPSPGR
jgi:quinol-cytochrome oxidoreductase complex cytochrome b subunit